MEVKDRVSYTVNFFKTCGHNEKDKMVVAALLHKNHLNFTDVVEFTYSRSIYIKLYYQLLGSRVEGKKVTTELLEGGDMVKSYIVLQDKKGIYDDWRLAGGGFGLVCGVIVHGKTYYTHLKSVTGYYESYLLLDGKSLYKEGDIIATIRDKSIYYDNRSITEADSSLIDKISFSLSLKKVVRNKEKTK